MTANKAFYVVDAIILLVVLGLGIAAYALRETPARAKSAKDAANAAVRQADPDKALTALQGLAADRRFATRIDGRFPFVHCFYGTRVPPDYIAQLSEELFLRYAAGGNPGPADIHRLKGLMAFIDALSPACSSSYAQSLHDRKLDGCFLVRDYDGAIAILEKGLPGHSANWVNGSIAKLRAHKAFAAGDKRGAVKWFLEFDRTLRAEGDDAAEDCDPSTGVVYSREWMIARNLARCAGLLAAPDINDRASALRYLEEAKGFYRKALDKAQKNQDTVSLAALKNEVKPFGL